MKVGDVVQLKGGGPKMTVSEIRAWGCFNATWFVVSGEPRTHAFHVDMVKNLTVEAESAKTPAPEPSPSKALAYAVHLASQQVYNWRFNLAQAELRPRADELAQHARMLKDISETVRTMAGGN